MRLPSNPNEIDEEEGGEIHALQSRVGHPVLVLHAVADHDGEGVALVHLVLDERHGDVLKQVVPEVDPVIVHVGLVHEQLHHHARALEEVLDRVRFGAADGLLAEDLRPLDDGLRRPLLVVDGLLCTSSAPLGPTLVEVAVHHEVRTALGQLVGVAHGHVEALGDADAVSHGDGGLHERAVLVAVLLGVRRRSAHVRFQKSR